MGRFSKKQQHDKSGLQIVSDDGLNVPLTQVGNSNRPSHQTMASTGLFEYRQIPVSPAINSTAFSNGARVWFDVEPHDVGHVHDMLFRWTITNSSGSPVSLRPAWHQLDRFVIWSDKGSGQEICRLHGECFEALTYLMDSQEERNTMANLIGYKSTKLNSLGQDVLAPHEKCQLANGETATFYLPVPIAFVKMRGLDFQHLRNDLRFIFEFASDNPAGCTIDSLDLLVKSVDEYSEDKQHRHKRQEANDHKYIFLDTQKLSYNNYTINNDVVYKYHLDQFKASSPFLIVSVKGSSAPTGSDKIQYVPLGKNATLDIVNSSGESLMGQGTALTEDMINHTWTDETGNPQPRGLYLIKFDKNTRHSLAGRINGYFYFEGDKDYLALNYGSSGTDLTYTLTPVIISATGTDTNFDGLVYQVEINGHRSALINSNESASSITSKVNAIKFLSDRAVSVKSVNNLGTDEDTTIVFNAKDSYLKHEIHDLRIIVNLRVIGSGGGADDYLEYYQPPVVSGGVQGFVGSSSDYTLDIFLFKFRELCVSKDGRMKVRDIV